MKPHYLAPLVLALFACEQAPQHSTPEQTSWSLGLITEQALQAHVAYLADDALEGRQAGKPGYDSAAAYVATALAEMGVEPGGVDGWYQAVNLRGYQLQESGAELLLHHGENDEALTYRDDFSMSADAVRESTRIRAEVVYAGFGVHAPDFDYSDYEGLDVEGKIVAVFRGAPEAIEGPEGAYYASSRTKSLEAVARGAIGSISLRSRKAETRRPWNDIKARFGRREQLTWLSDDGDAARHYPELQGGASFSIDASERLFGISPISFEEAHDASLASTPLSTPLGIEATLVTRSQHTMVKSANVIGLVRGTDPKLSQEYVVYTAHLDHIGVNEVSDEGGADEDLIHNGLYDNAMGVALMLETARAIAAAPPKRSVLFIALTAEEAGLLGSDFFVNKPTVAIEAIVANINLDMPLFIYPPADLVAFGSQHSSLQSVTEASANEEGFVLSPDPIPEERLFVRSDQYSFVRKGVPAVYLVSGFNSTNDDNDGEALFQDHLKNHYHEPSDDLTRPIAWDSAVRFARAHTRIGQQVANERDRPTWNEGDFFGERFGGK